MQVGEGRMEVFISVPVWVMGEPLPFTLELGSALCNRGIKPLDGEERGCDSCGRDMVKGGLAK